MSLPINLGITLTDIVGDYPLLSGLNYVPSGFINDGRAYSTVLHKNWEHNLIQVQAHTMASDLVNDFYSSHSDGDEFFTRIDLDGAETFGSLITTYGSFQHKPGTKLKCKIRGYTDADQAAMYLTCSPILMDNSHSFNGETATYSGFKDWLNRNYTYSGNLHNVASGNLTTSVQWLDLEVEPNTDEYYLSVWCVPYQAEENLYLTNCYIGEALKS